MDPINRQQLGLEAEQKSCVYLQQQGLILLQQNYRCYHGEIDLIMQDQDTIVFVEVRHRSHLSHGNALESVHFGKRKKIIKTAIHYLQIKKWLYRRNSRFDIVAIHPIGGKMQLEWVKNAFTVDNDR